MKRQIQPLRNSKVMLRLLELRDLPKTLQWRNQNSQWFFHSERIPPSQHLAWFKNYIERDDDFVFIIVADRAPVGQCSIYNVHWDEHWADFGRLVIDARYRRHGLATAATKLLTTVALQDWGLQAIYLQTLGTNLIATKVYRACGFFPVQVSDDTITMRRCG